MAMQGGSSHSWKQGQIHSTLLRIRQSADYFDLCVHNYPKTSSLRLEMLVQGKLRRNKASHKAVRASALSLQARSSISSSGQVSNCVAQCKLTSLHGRTSESEGDLRLLRAKIRLRWQTQSELKQIVVRPVIAASRRSLMRLEKNYRAI